MADPDAEKHEKRWFPLESTPDVMTKYVQNLGFDTTAHEFVDLLSTDDWALAMVPQVSASPPIGM